MMFKVILDKGSMFDIQMILNNINQLNLSIFPKQETLVIPAMGEIQEIEAKGHILEVPSFFTISILLPEEGDDFDKNEDKKQKIIKSLNTLFLNPTIEVMEEVIKMDMVSEILKDMRA